MIFSDAGTHRVPMADRHLSVCCALMGRLGSDAERRG